METHQSLIHTNGNVELSNEEIGRYSRHLIMPEVALEGQKKLKQAKVLTIGTGGLGSPLALYLAAAGVGTIGIVDFDVVDESNLQRQILHGTSDVGRPKVESAYDKLKDINPNVNVVVHEEALTSENALDILKDYDVIVDGTDNFPTRYLVNDACVLLDKPNVYGSIFRFEGQASVFWAEEGPCYRCLYPEPPPPGLVPSCAEGGVLGILPGAIGTVQATETVKLILGIGEPLVGRLMLYDALGMGFREMKLRKDPDCPVCGENPTVTELIDYQEFCGIPQAAAAEQENKVPEISVQELKAKMDNGGVQVLDVREPYEYEIANLGAPLIPLNELPQRYEELDREQPLAIHCRSGARSANAVKLLQERGFENVYNVEGRHPGLERGDRPEPAAVLAKRKVSLERGRRNAAPFLCFEGSPAAVYSSRQGSSGGWFDGDKGKDRISSRGAAHYTPRSTWTKSSFSSSASRIRIYASSVIRRETWRSWRQRVGRQAAGTWRLQASYGLGRSAPGLAPPSTPMAASYYLTARFGRRTLPGCGAGGWRNLRRSKSASSSRSARIS